ncbi:MAG: hypothetical protein ACOX6O_11975 [Christensenellales bacterium]|jgi:hypothetical protein
MKTTLRSTKTLAGLLALLLILSFTLTALAAMPAEVPAADHPDQPVLLSALGLTAQMVANASEAAFEGKQALWGKQLTSTLFASPLKAVVIRLTNEQAQQMGQTVGVPPEQLVRAVAKATNLQIDQDYAAVADAIAVQDVIAKDDPWVSGCTLILLVYDWDLSLSCVYQDVGVQSAFLIGRRSLAENINSTYVRAFASRLGVIGIDYTIYETADEVQTIFGKEQHSHYFTRLRDAIVHSEAGFIRMLPEIYASGIFDPVKRVGQSLAVRYLEKHSDDPNQALVAARFISKKIEPIVNKHFREKGNTDWRYADNAYERVLMQCAAPPALTYDPSPAAYDPSGKILTVYEKISDGEHTFFYDFLFESALPPARIPRSMEKADYILLLKTEWLKGEINNGIQLYNAHTVVTLHDAKTGALVKKLGEHTDKLEGLTVAHGNSYYQGSRPGRILNLVRNALFK